MCASEVYWRSRSLFSYDAIALQVQEPMLLGRAPIVVCSVSHRAEPAVRLVLLAALLFAPTAEAATLHGRVTHVVDGDTLDVVVKETRVRVRILDIDAPEYAQPYGHPSKQSLIALCGGEAAQINGDKHDRKLFKTTGATSVSRSALT